MNQDWLKKKRCLQRNLNKELIVLQEIFWKWWSNGYCYFKNNTKNALLLK